MRIDFKQAAARSSLGSTSGAAPCQFDRWCVNPEDGISGEPAADGKDGLVDRPRLVFGVDNHGYYT